MVMVFVLGMLILMTRRYQAQAHLGQDQAGTPSNKISLFVEPKTIRAGETFDVEV
jgi:hypothetical protein